MIAALKGTIANHTQSPITVWAGQVGYAVYTPPSYQVTLTEGDSIELFIHTHVRDDAFELFGFQTIAEKRLFELLLTVGGVGPKTALSVIDKGTDIILSAIRSSDITPFLSVPRLGQKNAKKIIIELQSKIGSIEQDSILMLTPQDDEVIEALLTMGFNRREIEKVIPKISRDSSIEQRIKTGLKLLAK